MSEATVSRVRIPRLAHPIRIELRGSYAYVRGPVRVVPSVIRSAGVAWFWDNNQHAVRVSFADIDRVVAVLDDTGWPVLREWVTI